MHPCPATESRSAPATGVDVDRVAVCKGAGRPAPQRSEPAGPGRFSYQKPR